MRLLHTADWHLGRQLHGQSLLDDQDHLLDQCVRLAVQEKVDAVLIAGDVYDRAVPPADAVALLDRTLARLVAQARIPVILIAGNHDSAERIAFGAPILAERGLIVRGTLEDLGPVRLQDAYGTVAIHPLPYAEPVQVRALMRQDAGGDHAHAMASLLARVRAQQRPHERQVLLAHAFVAGGGESESERPLSVGGSGAVPPSLFEGFHHVALGHLHRAQSVGAPHIRYSGSLYKYSFDETEHTKSVSIIDLDAQGASQVRLIPLSTRRDVRVLRGAFHDLLTAPDPSGPCQDYLSIRLTDSGPILDAMARLRQVYPHLLQVQFEPSSIATQPGSRGPSVEVRRRAPLDVFAAFAEQIREAPLGEAEREWVAKVIEDLQREARE